MSWGYSEEPTADDTVAEEIPLAPKKMGNSMFANDGMHEQNLTVQALAQKGVGPEHIEEALHAIEQAINNGLAAHEMPAMTRLSHADLERLYDEAAAQTGAPSSAELTAQKAQENQVAMDQLRGATGAVAAVGSTALISPASQQKLNSLSPQAQMEIAEEGAQLAHYTEMDGKDHSLAELGELAAQRVGTPTKSTEMGIA